MSDPESPQTGHDGGTDQARVTYVTSPVCTRDPERPQTGRDGGTDQARVTYVPTSHPESPQSIHHENESETETGSDATDRPPHFFIESKNSNDPDCTALMEVSSLNPEDPNAESDYRNREAVTDNNDEKVNSDNESQRLAAVEPEDNALGHLVNCVLNLCIYLLPSCVYFFYWYIPDRINEAVTRRCPKLLTALTRRRSIIASEKITPPGPLDILGYIVGLFTFGFDVYTDAHLAYDYYADGHTWWFGLTVLFIIVPMVIMTLFSSGLYYRQKSMFSTLHSEWYKFSPFQWFVRIIFSMLMLGPFIRMCDTLSAALRLNWQLLKNDGTDDILMKPRVKLFDYIEWVSTVICLMEAFMEAGPQLVLQLCALETMGWKEDNTQLGKIYSIQMN